jgi:hypothetical protein
MKALPLPPQNELLRILRYDPHVPGCLVWRIRPKYGIKAGTPAGSLGQNGRWRLRYKGQHIYHARAIWKMTYGDEPIHVDHRSLNKADNRVDNLRGATSSQNAANRWAKRKLPKGVSLRPSGRYRARIVVKQQVTNLGTFTTLEGAASAYARAAKRAFGEFRRLE